MPARRLPARAARDRVDELDELAADELWSALEAGYAAGTLHGDDRR